MNDFYRFIGKDSLGYINGNVYQLRQWTANYKGKPHHWISLPGGMQKCPYSSIDKFNENWLSVNVEPPINPKPLMPSSDRLMSYGNYSPIRHERKPINPYMKLLKDLIDRVR